MDVVGAIEVHRDVVPGVGLVLVVVLHLERVVADRRIGLQAIGATLVNPAGSLGVKVRSLVSKLTPISFTPTAKLKPTFGTLPLVKIAEFMVPDRASGSGPRYFLALSPLSPPRLSASCARAA